jgi:hypothetical protein
MMMLRDLRLFAGCWLPHKIRGFVGARFKAVICFFQEWLS